MDGETYFPCLPRGQCRIPRTIRGPIRWDGWRLHCGRSCAKPIPTARDVPVTARVVVVVEGLVQRLLGMSGCKAAAACCRWRARGICAHHLCTRLRVEVVGAGVEQTRVMSLCAVRWEEGTEREVWLQCKCRQVGTVRR